MLLSYILPVFSSYWLLLFSLLISVATFPTILPRILHPHGRKSGKLRFFKPSIEIRIPLLSLHRMQKLFSPIPLDSKLLFDGSYLTSCIRIEVGLLLSLDQAFDFLKGLLNYSVLSFDFQGNSVGWLNSDGSVEIIVAIFELFDESDGFVVAAIKLPSHNYNLMVCCNSRLLNQLALLYKLFNQSIWSIIAEASSIIQLLERYQIKQITAKI